MKALLPVAALVLLIALCAGSSILYLNSNYNTSALLTVLWVLGLTAWIGIHGKRSKTTE